MMYRQKNWRIPKLSAKYKEINWTTTEALYSNDKKTFNPLCLLLLFLLVRMTLVNLFKNSIVFHHKFGALYKEKWFIENNKSKKKIFLNYSYFQLANIGYLIHLCICVKVDPTRNVCRGQFQPIATYHVQCSLIRSFIQPGAALVCYFQNIAYLFVFKMECYIILKWVCHFWLFLYTFLFQFIIVII